jgi:hypothetical protein
VVRIVSKWNRESFHFIFSFNNNICNDVFYKEERRAIEEEEEERERERERVK